MGQNWQNNKKPTDLFIKSEQEQFYCTGLPMKFNTWKIKPIKVKEYPLYWEYIEFLKLQGWEVKSRIIKEIKGSIIETFVKEQLNDSSFLVCIQNNVFKLRDHYSQIFELFVEDFDPKFFHTVSDQEQFDNLRKLILSYNGIEFVETNPNPEIQRFNRMKLLINKSKGAHIDFDSMYTSICVGLCMKPHDVNDLTMYQFYALFNRLQFFKSYDTSTLYKTVDAKDKVKVIEWFKSTKEKEEETLYNSTEDLKKANVFMKK